MTLERTKIALFASILLLPIIASSAYADGSAEIVAVCGFTAPNDIPLGLIVYGLDSDEVNFSIDVDGNGIGTLELEASDWTGTEQLEYAQLIIDLKPDVLNGDRMVFSNIVDITGTSAGNSGQHYNAGSNVEGDADNFVLVMNANPNYPGTAEHIGDGIVVITSKYPQGHIWIDGNEIADIPITFTATQNEFSPMLTDGFVYESNITVLPAETTRYSVTDNGTPSSGTTYAEKTALAPTGQTKILTTEAFRVNPINLSFQLTGVDVLDDVDYLGAITQTWTFTYYCTE